MKKQKRPPLVIHRDTLRSLSPGSLGDAAGGTLTPTTSERCTLACDTNLVNDCYTTVGLTKNLNGCTRP